MVAERGPARIPAAMATRWETAKGEVANLMTGLSESIATNSVDLPQAIMSVLTLLSTTYNTLATYHTAAADQMQNIEGELQKHEHMLLMVKGGGPKSHSGILESKAIGGLMQVGATKEKFRVCNEKMINAVAQVRPGSREVFKKMMETFDLGKDPMDWWRLTQSSQ